MPTTYWTEDEVEQHCRDLADQAQAAAAKVEQLKRALRGGNPVKDNAELLEWLADRLVHQYGESPNVDYIHACRDRAAMIRAALAA